MNSIITVEGRVEIELRGPDGRVKYRGITHNIATNSAEDYIAEAIVEKSRTKTPLYTAMAGIILGSDGTTPAKTDDDVVTRLTGDPASAFQAFDSGYPDDEETGNEGKVVWQAYWDGSQGNQSSPTIKEGAIKSAQAATDAVSRFLIAAPAGIAKSSGDTLRLRVVWTLSGV